MKDFNDFKLSIRSSSEFKNVISNAAIDYIKENGEPKTTPEMITAMQSINTEILINTLELYHNWLNDI